MIIRMFNIKYWQVLFCAMITLLKNFAQIEIAQTSGHVDL